MATIINIQGIGKRYNLRANGGYLSLREVVSRKAAGLFRAKRSKDDFWALKDIDLRVEKGDRLGIIGRNGAGKSTLLKIISRITPPTKGTITIEGRVASLLEVGTGFHPELTGRENIYFNGSILGLKKKEIDVRLDAIIDFSGMERFIGTPLKHYSSGMQLRLAFSVAAHLEPEVLLIDEVLAVGDIEFQKKCIGKMEEVSKSEGRTILFVSHNMSYITALCNKGLLLDGGIVRKTGTASEAIAAYLSGINSFAAAREWRDDERPGNAIVRLGSVRMVDAGGEGRESFGVDESIGIEMRYEVLQPGSVLWLGHNLYNDKGINIFDTHSVDTHLYTEPHRVGWHTATAWIPPHLLNTGNLVVSTAIFNHAEGIIHLHEKDVLLFHVHEVFETLTARGNSPGDFPGVVRPRLRWTINNETS